MISERAASGRSLPLSSYLFLSFDSSHFFFLFLLLSLSPPPFVVLYFFVLPYVLFSPSLPICSISVEIYVVTISASRIRISIPVRVYVRARADAHQRAEMCSARKCMHEGIVLKRGTAVIPIRAKCACDRRRRTWIVRQMKNKERMSERNEMRGKREGEGRIKSENEKWI